MRHRSTLALAIALAATLAAPDAAAQGAPAPPRHVAQFGGDARHTGRTPHRGPRAAPSIAWRVRARHRIFASPVLTAEGHILFVGVDGMAHAVDARGVERWAWPAPHDVFATPAVVGDLALVAHDGPRGDGPPREGAVVALDSRGQRVWSIATPESVDAPPTVGPDGVVYVASRGVIAVTPRGEVRWRAAANAHAFAAPSLSVDGATVYLADLGGELSFLRARDGAVERRVRVGAPVYGAPLVLDDGAIVVGAGDGHVRAYAPDGALRWDFATRGEVRATPALGRDGTVIVGSDDGGIYGLRDGAQVFRVATSGRVRASARVDPDGYVYVGGEDDTLYALDPRGAVAWTFPSLGADIDSSALVTPDGAIVVGCDDAGLYYLAPPRSQ